MTQRYEINDYDKLTQNVVIPVATSFVDGLENGIITVCNSAGPLTGTVLDNSSVSINTVGKSTVTIQVGGTWSTSTLGGLYLQVSIDGITWQTISNSYNLLRIMNMDYDNFIRSGFTGIWQVETIGYSDIRIVCMDTLFSGSAIISLRTSVHQNNYFANSGLPVVRLLSSVGDGTGTTNLIGNYSGAVTDFWYQPPSTQKFYIHNISMNISDNTSFNQTDYGAISGGLTNGVTLWINIAGTDYPLASGLIFKSNIDFMTLSPHNNLTSFAGTSQTLVVDINLIEDFGIPLILDGTQNAKFIIRLHDNFTSLIAQTVSLRGRLV